MGKTQKHKKMSLAHIIAKLLEMINTIKLYHWKTYNYATHKATDDLFSELNTKIDEFVEVLLGSTNINRNSLQITTIKVVPILSNVECKTQINNYINFLIHLKGLSVDLISIRDEIIALLHRFLYLLSLS
jgi:hypothetical protein